LKKYRHSQDLRFKIADFRFIIAKNKVPFAFDYWLNKDMQYKSATQGTMIRIAKAK